MDLSWILVAVVICAILNAVVSVLLARAIAAQTRAGLGGLAPVIGEALQAVVEDLPGLGGESPEIEINPLQAMVLEIFKERLKPPALQVTEIQGPRESSGQFSKKDPQV